MLQHCTDSEDNTNSSLTPAVAGAAASGVLYVESNNPNVGRNSVLAYRRNADGSLTLIDEFLIGGTGTGNINQLLGPDDIDKEMAVSADHRFLFAVNSGSQYFGHFLSERG
jgi:hypothetical protein